MTDQVIYRTVQSKLTGLLIHRILLLEIIHLGAGLMLLTRNSAKYLRYFVDIGGLKS